MPFGAAIKGLGRKEALQFRGEKYLRKREWRDSLHGLAVCHARSSLKAGISADLQLEALCENFNRTS